MPQVAMRAFNAALEQGTPDAVYLLHGDNDFLKEEKLRELVNRLVDPSTRDFNYDLLRAVDVDAARLSASLDALPVLASRRVVVIHDIGALKKDAKTAIDRYLTRPASDVVLVMVAASGWKVDTTLMSRASTVELRQLTEDETIRWTIARAPALDAQIKADAARLLVRATGQDIALIDGELRKLRDYSAGLPITAMAVNAIVGIRAGETTSDLLDAVCARDGVYAASLVELVLSQPKASGVTTVLALTTQLLGIGHVLSLRHSGAGPRQLGTELYALMGEARSSVVGRPWGEAVAAWSRHADRWDEPAVKRALLLLRDADRAMKESSLSNEGQALATLVLTICDDRRSRVA